ncbi:MAG: [protein-PII] uridylyltransferase family protein [Planctomycetota bacterium]|jgi:glutamate-ammonia-ligase adenylyltransferase
MQHDDPKVYDWPLPDPQSDEAAALENIGSVQSYAEGIRLGLRDLPEATVYEFIDALSRVFDESPKPERSVQAVERILRAYEDAQDFSAAVLDDRAAFRALFELCGHSEPLSYFLSRHGWRDFMSGGLSVLSQSVSSELVRSRVSERLRNGDNIKAALRLTCQESSVQVLYHEALQNQSLETVGNEISAIADGCIQAALDFLSPAPDLKFCVIAFGKLGGGELNYSSDIDLVFLYDGKPEQARVAKRLAEKTVELLNEVTEHGRVFRVDTRLRPEGKRGKLAPSVQSALDYYFSYGSTWERQALLKARACAGDIEVGEKFLERLQGWVFRKYLTVEEINQMKTLKRIIEKRTDDRNESFRDVKTGFGGLRDIEYVVQFLQLMNGGRLPGVRNRATLPALKALVDNGVLHAEEAGELAAGYRFLRAVEHRLQLDHGMQTHTLPNDLHGILFVARAMGITADRQLNVTRKFVRELQTHTIKVRGLLLRLFSGLFLQESTGDHSEIVLDRDMTAERAQALLEPYGFVDAAGAFQLIRDLAEESLENRLYEPRARKYLASMLPALLDYCAESPEPDATLRNFENIVSRLGAKTMLFELIAEDPRALQIFGAIAAHTHWLSDILARRPGLVDEFIDELQTFTSLERARLENDLQSRIEFAEDAIDAMHWQRDIELLRIGLFDITGRTPLFETLRELAILAEVILQHAIALAINEAVLRDEFSEVDSVRAGENLAVVGMGKLGATALNYASDLDLVFVYSPAAFDDTSVAKAFYARVVRKVKDLMAAHGDHRKLYEIDLRLRPHGGSSSLAVSITEFKKYLQDSAGFWERLAATRARVICRSGKLSEQLNEVLKAFAFEGGPDSAATREMRLKIEQEGKQNLLKRGPGGTLDVEFLVAHLQQKHASESPELCTPDIVSCLQILHENKFISSDAFDTLSGGYAYLRQVVNRLQVLDGVSIHEVVDDEHAEVFARRLGYKGGNPAEEFLEELDWYRGKIRKVFDELLV